MVSKDGFCYFCWPIPYYSAQLPNPIKETWQNEALKNDELIWKFHYVDFDFWSADITWAFNQGYLAKYITAKLELWMEHLHESLTRFWLLWEAKVPGNMHTSQGRMAVCLTILHQSDYPNLVTFPDWKKKKKRKTHAQNWPQEQLLCSRNILFDCFPLKHKNSCLSK